jgi:hypothetical protein
MENRIIAVVLRSSFSTVKGILVRNMIFPNYTDDDFFL